MHKDVWKFKLKINDINLGLAPLRLKDLFKYNDIVLQRR